MRVYISVDMEGIGGINHPHPTDPADRRYATSVALMVGETNARGVVADHAAILPGAERVGNRTVRFTADDPVTAYRGFLAINRLADATDG